MAEKTGIQWTDSTFNPWWGCQKVGPGCDHCYAEALDKRTGGDHWGVGKERRRTSQNNWNQPRRWNRRAAEFFAEHGRRRRVFCASMADVFDNAVPDEWRLDLWNLIIECDQIDWQIVTKRAGNVIGMMPHGLKHVGILATVVNQEEADRDIPKLLQASLFLEFGWCGLSIEPMLGPIDLRAFAYAVDWVICGGESGPAARAPQTDWFRALRDECVLASVPFFFKQFGEYGPAPWALTKDSPLVKMGKKQAGRSLDGHEWSEFPKVAA